MVEGVMIILVVILITARTGTSSIITTTTRIKTAIVTANVFNYIQVSNIH